MDCARFFWNCIAAVEPGLTNAPKLSDTKCEKIVGFNTENGEDCEYILYSDAGEGYDYEEGEYTLRKYVWKDDENCLYDEDGNIVENTIDKS